MTFPTAQAELQHYKQLEAECRKTRGAGAIHPDLCPKLTLHGVDFAIPPRGVSVRPSFDGETVSVSCSGQDDWPDADELVRNAPAREGRNCPSCRQATAAALKIDLTEGADFLGRCY